MKSKHGFDFGVCLLCDSCKDMFVADISPTFIVEFNEISTRKIP